MSPIALKPFGACGAKRAADTGLAMDHLTPLSWEQQTSDA